MPLSERALLKVAGDRSYARGEDYVRYVRCLRITAEKAHASVQAKRVYTVELDWSGPQPDGSCTCPHAADGHFCIGGENRRLPGEMRYRCFLEVEEIVAVYGQPRWVKSERLFLGSRAGVSVHRHCCK